MANGLIRSQLLKSKELILNEAKHVNGFMDLLMKQRNTGYGWTKGEKAELRRYVMRLAAYIPVLLVFLLPGGFILIPVLAEILDRRKTVRPLVDDKQGEIANPDRSRSLD